VCTVAAGLVTAHFNAKIARLCIDKKIDPDDFILSHFDCRLGHYSSWDEAISILLWRAYDCSINGVSDAVYHTRAAGKQVMGAPTGEKLRWLHENGRLPLSPHQAHGSYFVRVRRVIEGFNPKTQTTVMSLRGRVEKVDAHVLEMARKDAMLLEDDVLPS